MTCRVAPFALLGILVLRAVDLWRVGELDPFTVATVVLAGALAVWLVRQPGCEGAACVVPAEGRSGEDDQRAAAASAGR